MPPLSTPPHAPSPIAFMPQYRSALLPDGLPWGPNNGNCGPTSIVNVLRLVGLDVPGFSGQRSQAVIDAARKLVSGNADPSAATTKTQQAFALRAAGAHVNVTRSLNAALDDARRGVAILIGGNRAAADWPRRADDPPPTKVASHAAVIAAYDRLSDRFTVLDPALPAPVMVTAHQIRLFTEADALSGRMPRLALSVTNPRR